MSKDRIEIEKAENGFTMRVWKEEDKKDEYGYQEPELFVANTVEDVLVIVKENLK